MISLTDKIFEIKTFKQNLGKKIEGAAVVTKRKNLEKLRTGLKKMNFNTIPPEVMFGQRKPTAKERIKSTIAMGKTVVGAVPRLAKGYATDKAINTGRKLQGRKPIGQLKGGHNMSRAATGSISPNKYIYGS